MDWDIFGAMKIKDYAGRQKETMAVNVVNLEAISK
jgi:hypothetical protein